MKYNKFLTTGVLVGILLTLFVQWGANTYNAKRSDKQISTFVQGYKSAADKNAFVKSFDYGKKVSVNISSSKAAPSATSWGLIQVAKCREIQATFRDKYDELNSIIDMYQNSSGADMTQDTGYIQVMADWNQAISEWDQYKCSDVYNFLSDSKGVEE